ncbi:hypothetical protein N7489_000429 [Penicillium chrysogenum]|jgi:hypothetical protein|uniref:Uncharacterized protein n=1 Tax=Penicillium chrysogenum TaxID=5076 RepID=A0ABQ8WFU0_PENCH|nr:uncharacterized protein N7489_000429 [Penicillium chrysogenum]XP_061068221.1 uncharacterized protein N7525_006624 [Penicillium rubens]KAJ5250019.1 hypothetical protein N7489_000429 [Penicillium chrysogenum]KAJ5268927.1 hypothetical protein N7505_004685 [Penicillium chrysogenum]KAJ5828371.1 hypothetical protein N7525_006624 [Penicillium rubens]KAJ5841903.1 hypothetical protein N7534_011733 [Penicillium rubens]
MLMWIGGSFAQQLSALAMDWVTVAVPIAKAGYDTSGDPTDNNSNNAEAGLLCNNSGRWREIDKVMELYTIENGVADSDVCEVHTERMFPFDAMR